MSLRYLLLVCCGGLLIAAVPVKKPASQPATRPASVSLEPASKPTPHRKPPKDWWRDAVFYQIFVRSFQDTNGDGIGDLKGIIKRLDTLKSPSAAGSVRSLGVSGLWLTPIFASPSYHGYDVTNYKKIQPTYGSAATLKQLLQKAHQRDMRVLLDLMVNHTSRKHPWFLKSRKPSSPYRRWYVWRKQNPGWTQPWGRWPSWHRLGDHFYYGIFWSGMPDLNLAHPPARKAIFSIARHWLKQGIDGYRLDAARHLFANGPGEKQNDQPDTHTFWRDFRRHTKATSTNALLVGEVWASAKVIRSYCKGDEFDLTFHFPLAKAIQMTVSAMETKPLWKVLQMPVPHRCWATFLTNHDQTRWATRLVGQKKMLRMGAWLLLTLPGTPFVYYGEELGMGNGSQKGDPGKRTPMPWDASAKGGFTTGTPWTKLAPHKEANVATQQQDPGSLWHLYRKLIHQRNQSIALRRGGLKRLSLPPNTKGATAIVAFSREYKKNKKKQVLWSLLNVNDEASGVFVLPLPTGAKPRLLLKEGQAHWSQVGDTLRLKLGPQSGLLFAL